MLSLSEDSQSDVIEAFNSTSRYLDDRLNIDNNFFDSMVNCIYPSKLQLNKAKVSDTDASLLDLHLSILDGFVKTRDDFDFPFLDGDIPRSTSYGVYISQFVRFVRVSSHVLRARRNEKEFKVKPATSFKYFQYLLTDNLKQRLRQKKILFKSTLVS